MALKTAQSRSFTIGSLYVTLSATDPRWGTFIAYWGSQAFAQNNINTGKPVYPVITSWGDIRKMLTVNGSARDATVSFDVHANAKFVLSNKTASVTVAQFIREVNVFDLDVSIVQWNKFDSSQETIWIGKWSSSNFRHDQTGIPVITVQLTPWGKSWQLPASDLVARSTFATAPPQGMNKMIPLAYGDAQKAFNIAASSYHDPLFYGFQMPGFPGVPIKEDASVVSTTYRFAKNDGTSAAATVDVGATNNLTDSCSLWVYDRQVGAMGMVDATSYVIRNTATEVEADIDASPRVHLGIIPTEPGTYNNFASGIYKVFDSDPLNFITSSAVEFRLSLNMPRVAVAGVVEEIRIGVICENGHATKNRKISFGLLNEDDFSGVPNWLNSVAWTTSPIAPGTGIINILYGSTTQKYVDSDCKGTVMAGNGTGDSFTHGTFISQDANELNHPLELLVEVQDIGGVDAGRDGVKIYGVVAIVKVHYDGPRRLQPYTLPNGAYYDKRGRGVHIAERPPWMNSPFVLGTYQNSDLEYMMFMQGQKDDGSGTYTGTPSGIIERVTDVVYHLFNKRFGEQVNTTAGTLGNVPDLRATTAELNFITMCTPIGPDIVTREDAKKVFESKFPVRIHRGRLDGKIHVIGEEMNPLSCRWYGGASAYQSIPASDVLAITGGSQVKFADIQNNVTVQFNIGANGNPLRSYTYQNPLSAKLFGLRQEQLVNEPWVETGAVGGVAPNSVQALAWWLGRRKARPRYSDITVKLPQEYYDLEIGHVIDFEKDGLERRGLVPPFYRCGLMDYVLVGGAGTWTDNADVNNGSLFRVAGGTQSIYYGFSQQIDEIDINLSVASAYTGNATHNYSSTAGFTAFSTQPTNRDAFKSTGPQSILYTRPQVDLWRKTEITLDNGVTYGPCYWIRVDASTPTVSGTQQDFYRYPPRWWGRFLEVIEVLRQPGANPNDYPFVEVVVQELM